MTARTAINKLFACYAKSVCATQRLLLIQRSLTRDDRMSNGPSRQNKQTSCQKSSGVKEWHRYLKT